MQAQQNSEKEVLPTSIFPKQKKSIAYFEAPLLEIFDFAFGVLRKSFVLLVWKKLSKVHFDRCELEHYFNQKNLKSTTKIRLFVRPFVCSY
jgi:hypothetical protein